MTLIEGLGDEVTFIFTTLLTIIILFLIFLIKHNGFTRQQEPSTVESIRPVSNNFDNSSNDTNSSNLVTLDAEIRENIGLNTQNLDSEINLFSKSNPVKSTLPNTNENQETTNESHHDHHENSTGIRIQYVDGRQRYVLASLDDTIGHFKLENFNDELRVGEMVRLIACGRELKDENLTLRDAGLNNDGVLHCLITRIPAVNNVELEPQQNVGRNISAMLVPLLGLLLSLLWYFRLVYKPAFTGLSTFLLAAITSVFLLILILNINRQLSNPQRPHQL